MKNFAKLFFPMLFLSIQTASAQSQQPEMADVMRSNGKIYVVVTIIVIVLVGLIAYLITLDRKITRLERELPVKK